jgi:hypothetical protein
MKRTDCLECRWCKKAGLMGNYHCFAPCFSEAEMLQGVRMPFIQSLGCLTFEPLAGEP